MKSSNVQAWFFKLRRTHDDDLAVSRHLTKAWSQRYFVLVRDRIVWFASKIAAYKGLKPSGFVNFQQVTRIKVLNSVDRLKDEFNRDEYGTYSIEIDSHSRRLVIRTVSRDVAIHWVHHLRAKMKSWTDRTGMETIREVAKKRKSVDTRDLLIARIERAMEQIQDKGDSDEDSSIREEVSDHEHRQTKKKKKDTEKRHRRKSTSASTGSDDSQKPDNEKDKKKKKKTKKKKGREKEKKGTKKSKSKSQSA